MLTLLLLASLGQCSGGACALPSAGYSYAPQFSYAPSFLPSYQPAAPVVPPQVYRLADSDGTFYTHTDPTHLQRWMATHNAELAAAKAKVVAAPPPANRPIEPMCSCEQRSGWCPCKQGIRATPPAASARPIPAETSVHFSPSTECEAEIVGRINGAKRSIHVLAYSFTSAPVAQALIAANARGVDVRVVLDKDQSTGRGSELPTLRAAGIPVLTDSSHPIMHDKVVIVDGKTVLAGSYNFSAQAQHNAENLLTLDSAPLAARYLADWERHAAHSDSPAHVAIGPPPPDLR
jgi:phosphatidylserine/phosphatidylglycerophosphate/cardiolipin synthase-like enzyme